MIHCLSMVTRISRILSFCRNKTTPLNETKTIADESEIVRIKTLKFPELTIPNIIISSSTMFENSYASFLLSKSVKKRKWMKTEF